MFWLSRLSWTSYSTVGLPCNVPWSAIRTIGRIMLCVLSTPAESPRLSRTLRCAKSSIATSTGNLLEIVNYNVEVSTVYFVCHHVFTSCAGPAIRLRRRARCSPDHDKCAQLSQGSED